MSYEGEAHYGHPQVPKKGYTPARKHDSKYKPPVSNIPKQYPDENPFGFDTDYDAFGLGPFDPFGPQNDRVGPGPDPFGPGPDPYAPRPDGFIPDLGPSNLGPGDPFGLDEPNPFEPNFGFPPLEEFDFDSPGPGSGIGRIPPDFGPNNLFGPPEFGGGIGDRIPPRGNSLTRERFDEIFGNRQYT